MKLSKDLLEIFNSLSKTGRVIFIIVVLLYSGSLLISGFFINRGLWRYYQQRYANAMIDLDDAYREGTRIAEDFLSCQTEIALSPPREPIITPSATPRVSSPTPPLPTPVITISPSVTPSTTNTLTPSELINGTCDKAKPPCLYYGALSWQEVTVFLFSHAEKCRWPEIASLNRRPNGHYYLPLPEDAGIFIHQVAPSGTHHPMIRLDSGDFIHIDYCSSTTGKPCVYLVESGIFGASLEAYKKIAAKVYGDGADINARRIMDANLASDCSGSSIELSPGVLIVIPK
jgi:hypothetical protein